MSKNENINIDDLEDLQETEHDFNQENVQNTDIAEDENSIIDDETEIDTNIQRPGLNKGFIKLILFIIGFIFLTAIVIALSVEPGKKKRKETEDATIYNTDIPRLEFSESDYNNGNSEDDDKKISPAEMLEINKQNIDPLSNATYAEEEYKTYDKRKDVDIVIKKKETPKIIPSRSLLSGNNNENDNEEKIRRSSLFFTTSNTSSSNTSKETASSDEKENYYKYLENQAKISLITDYQKQNMQREKEEWLDERKSDFSSYLASVYLEPFDIRTEIKAGTMIPITLLTGINSDLPGPIKAQVSHHVYDTVTGQNLLIPSGSTVIGQYDSTIAFGQERVLIAWHRIIRPDGISLTIGGMQGVDLSGKSGIKGNVDNHFKEIAAALTLSTTFNIAVNSITSLIANNEDLSFLAQNNSKDNPATQIAQQYVEKTLNRQPTINIESGEEAYIFVSKDIILPPFKSWGSY